MWYKKIILAVALLIVLFTSGIQVYGKASDGTLNFYYDQWGSPGFETINDWVKVGSSGYETYFSLDSLTSCTEDAVSSAGLKTQLKISVPATKTVPAGTWAGYEFTLPNSSIYPYEDIIRMFTGGYYNLPSTTQLRLTDAAGNVLWTYSTLGWINTTTPYFLPGKNIVRLIVYQTAAANVWAGNYAYTELMRLDTQQRPTWFGYYHVDTQFGNGVWQVWDYTNIAHIDLYKYSNLADLDTLAEQYKSHKIKMLVDTIGVFFNTAYPQRLWDQATIDWRWAYLRDRIERVRQHNSVDFDIIAGFYISDEPFWNGALYNDVYNVSACVKAWYPQYPTMITEAYVMLDDPQYTSLSIPPNIDWVGFDKYLTSGQNFDSVIPWYLARLKAKLTSSQAIWLVPQAMTGPTLGMPVVSDTTLRDWQYKWYDLARSDSQIHGMLCFTYPYVFDVPLTRGAHQLIGPQLIQPK